MTQREAFNKQFEKVDKGYTIPAGSVVSWNDIAAHLEALIDPERRPGYEDNMQKDLKRQDALRVRFIGGATKKTKLGKFYYKFNSYLKGAIFDGRIALLQRGGTVAQDISDIELPETLLRQSAAGYCFSSTELKRVLKDYHIDFASKNEDLELGYKQFSAILDTVLTKCTDYSAAGLAPVNRPVPEDKLQNTPATRPVPPEEPQKSPVQKSQASRSTLKRASTLGIGIQM